MEDNNVLNKETTQLPIVDCPLPIAIYVIDNWQSTIHNRQLGPGLVMAMAGFATEELLGCLREEVKSLARIITASIRTLKERGVGKEAK